MIKKMHMMLAGMALFATSCAQNDDSVNSDSAGRSIKIHKIQIFKIGDTTQTFGIIKVDTARWMDSAKNFVGDTIVKVDINAKQATDTITLYSSTYYRYFVYGKLDCPHGVYCGYGFSNGPIRFSDSDSEYFSIKISSGQLVDMFPLSN